VRIAVSPLDRFSGFPANDRDYIGRDCAHPATSVSKNGEASTHTLQGDEIRALRRLEQLTPYVFNSERGGPSITTVMKLLGQRTHTRRLICFNLATPNAPRSLRDLEPGSVSAAITSFRSAS